MQDLYQRTQMLIGEDAICRLQSAKVIIFGLGGVGGYAVEALARAGVGTLALVDCDVVSASNLNRQILATHSSIGRRKCEVAKERVLQINPSCEVSCFDMFFDEQSASQIGLEKFDYIVDAIDTISSKVLLARLAQEHQVNIISCMGTGGRLDADFAVMDIWKTSGCPLARAMRKLLKASGVRHLKVVCAITPANNSNVLQGEGRHIPGSISYVPAQAGLKLAQEVILHFVTMAESGC